jgi:hypothetical protein
MVIKSLRNLTIRIIAAWYKSAEGEAVRELAVFLNTVLI